MMYKATSQKHGLTGPPFMIARLPLGYFEGDDGTRKADDHELCDQSKVASEFADSLLQALDSAQYCVYGFVDADDGMELDECRYTTQPHMNIRSKQILEWRSWVESFESGDLRALNVFWINFFGEEMQRKLPKSLIDDFLALPDIDDEASTQWVKRLPNGGLTLALSNDALEVYVAPMNRLSTAMRNAVWLSNQLRRCGLL